MRPAAPNQSNRHLAGLHGLRGLAALATVVFHIDLVPQPVLPVPPVLDRIVPYLGMGVDLFFVLSAFVLLHANTRQVGRPGWVGTYLVKRLFRIAPLFYVMLAIYCGWYVVHRAPLDPAAVLATATFIFNFVPSMQQSIVNAGWTIGVEMPFYLLLPLVLLTVRTLRQALWCCAGAVAISVVARLALAVGQPVSSTGPYMISLLSNLGVFGFGIAAYHAAQVWRPGRVQVGLCGILALGWLSLLPLGYGEAVLLPGRPDVLFWSAPLGLLCLWQAMAPSRLLRSRPLQWLGEVSYSLYLTHPFLVWLLFHFGAYGTVAAALTPAIGRWVFLVQVAMTLTINLPLAALAYALVEKPGQRAGEFVLRRIRPSTAPVQGGRDDRGHPVSVMAAPVLRQTTTQLS